MVPTAVLASPCPRPSSGPRKVWKEWRLSRDRYLTPEQIATQLLPAAKRLPDPRAHFALWLAANTGARVSELISLRAQDVHPSEPRLSIVTLKRRGRPIRELLLPEQVVQKVRDWFTHHAIPPDGFLLPSFHRGKHVSRQRVAQWFTLAAVAAGVKVWKAGKHAGNGIHALRHGNALAWMQRLASVKNKSPLDMLLTISERLGHSSLRSTLTYLHPSQSAESVAAVGPIGD
jgi:integrase